MSELLQRLVATVVGPQHVSTAAADLADYAPAGTPPPGDVVVWPASAGEIAQVLEVAKGNGAALLAVRRGTRRRAVGSTRPGSAPRPARPTVLVDQRRMTSVLHLDETSLVAHAQAGITGRALEEVLGRRGLTLGYFPLEAFALPLGALLARRRPELAAARVGPIHGACLGVSAVLADGLVVHSRVAPRHAAGPDLLQLLLGCEGGLGIITAAVLRVRRIPESRTLSAFAYPTVPGALEAGVECLRRGARLAALRVYDAADAARCLGDGGAEGPDVPAAGALLVCCCAGPTELAAAEARVLADAAKAFGGSDVGAAPAEHWWRRRTDSEEGPAAKDPDALVLPAPLPALAPLHAAVVSASTAAHARCRVSIARLHRGGGCVLVTLEGDKRSRERAHDRILEAAATIVGEPCDPLREATAALRAVLDPGDIMSPGSLAVAPC
ncbi:MAG: FAD-binding oxidoreductase [Deltaproteobacteria bacterium]|nr:FAD-binding oxidoreductase [Deltaproteobacteria bacterium]